MILAIDPATITGYAIINKKGTIKESGIIDLRPKRNESAGMRFVNMYKSIRHMVDKGILMVVFEEVKNHKGTYAAQIYGGLVSCIQLVCHDYDIPYTAIPVGTIKKHATGKGNANKQDMINAAATKWPGIEIKDDNHADALCLEYVQRRKY